QMRAGNFEDAGAGLVGIDRIASGLNTMNIPVQRQQIQFRQDDSDRRFQRQGEQFDASQAQQRNLTAQRIAAARENSQRAAQSPTQKAVNSLIQMRDAGLIDDEGYQSRFESLINPPPEYGKLEEGRDSEGNPVFMRENKRTRQFEQVEGFSPVPPKGANLGDTEKDLAEADRLREAGVIDQKGHDDRVENILNPTGEFKDEDKLRKDFQAVTKDFRKVRDAQSRVVSSSENPSPAGDMALIFNYMKILDPGSVVRESEFQLAGNAGSLPERAQRAYDRIVKGNGLSPAMRKDFVDRSSRLFNAQNAQYQQTKGQFRDLATRYRMNPDNITLDFDIANQGRIENKELSDDDLVNKWADDG
ncbi:MAG: hypothetical protein GY938_11050, partial [Ketobacter sp.]|nr:hypothetical protein [Ketobacter sp.]